MKSYQQLVDEYAKNIKESFPWDINNLQQDFKLIIDVREAEEFKVMRIKNSINIPRGVLEMACEWNYEHTFPELVKARSCSILVVCRSGHRSVFAVNRMQQLGYKDVSSLKLGLRGWFEFDQELVDDNNVTVDEIEADKYFASHVSDEQLSPR